MYTPRYKPVADHALLIEFATAVSDDVNIHVVAVDEAIANASIHGILEVIPALVNLLVVFDPLETDHAAVQREVDGLLPLDANLTAKPRRHDIDVCYDQHFGIDLAAVATAQGISVEAVIDAHLSAEYRVCMYGFAPGYAYLSGVCESIQVPRKRAAVRDIRAGSILIAGPQCLATTMIMPTGWSIIGYTPAQIMRDDSDNPFLFDVGDSVRFRRIGLDALPESAVASA